MPTPTNPSLYLRVPASRRDEAAAVGLAHVLTHVAPAQDCRISLTIGQEPDGRVMIYACVDFPQEAVDRAQGDTVALHAK
jgi:hypothetical protein